MPAQRRTSSWCSTAVTKSIAPFTPIWSNGKVFRITIASYDHRGLGLVRHGGTKSIVRDDESKMGGVKQCRFRDREPLYKPADNNPSNAAAKLQRERCISLSDQGTSRLPSKRAVMGHTVLCNSAQRSTASQSEDRRYYGLVRN